MIRNFLAVGKAAARFADDKKAVDITLLDVRRFSSVADYYLLATAESTPQLQALQDYLDEKLKEQFHVDPLRRDGRSSSAWSVLDYGGLVVHLMNPSSRQFYDLERLWEGARRVEWEAQAKVAVAAAAPRHKPAKPARAKRAPPRKGAGTETDQGPKRRASAKGRRP